MLRSIDHDTEVGREERCEERELVLVNRDAVHVTLVLVTGALRNLNHMYAARDDYTWWGAGIFAISLIVMAAAWVAVRPAILSSLAGLTGSVRR